MAELSHAKLAERRNWEAAVNRLCSKLGCPSPSISFEEGYRMTKAPKTHRGSVGCSAVHTVRMSTGGFTSEGRGKNKREARQNACRLLYYQLCSHILPKEGAQ